VIFTAQKNVFSAHGTGLNLLVLLFLICSPSSRCSETIWPTNSRPFKSGQKRFSQLKTFFLFFSVELRPELACFVLHEIHLDGWKLILTNELVELQVLSKSDFHSSKKTCFSVFSGRVLNLFVLLFSRNSLRCMKPDFDQRISQIPSFKQKWFLQLKKRFSAFFSNYFELVCFLLFLQEIHLGCMKTRFWPTNWINSKF
jgi:hypothetical protein